MSVCAICLDVLKAPVALPCGHVYCHSCISEAVKATASTSLVTHCPTCREPVPTVAPNPLFVPPHLRGYVQPPFRRLYLDDTSPSTMPTDPALSLTAVEETDKISARLHMENAVLRQCCHAWRARANAHVAAQLGLSTFLHLARDQARILKGERDELARKYDALKRKFSDVDDREPEPEPEPESDSEEQQNSCVWDKPGAQAQDESEAEAGTPASSDDVPCVPLVRPVADVPAVSRPGPQGTSKRRRISPVSLYSAVPAKSTTSVPAMVIPHVAPRQSATSARSTVFDN